MNQNLLVPKLGDVFDLSLLQEMQDGNFVRTRSHPDYDLTVYNYTEHAQFDRVWNPVTLACRGLVVDGSGRVVARPLKKFFNYSEVGAASAEELSGEVIVTDKLDGSLGILVPTPDGKHIIATRGSFMSEQALHATAVWQSKYEGKVTLDPSLTYLFEIIYPSNRIVLNYGDLDDLVLIGAVRLADGVSLPPAAVSAGWPGPVVEVLSYGSLTEALAATPRANAEGLVVHALVSDQRVKIKQEDYVRLHRIVTGINERAVWDALSSGVPLDKWLVGVPEEFASFVTETADNLLKQYDVVTARLSGEWELIKKELGEVDFKAYALEITKRFNADSFMKAAMFEQMRGRDISTLVWGSLRPEYQKSEWAARSD